MILVFLLFDLPLSVYTVLISSLRVPVALYLNWSSLILDRKSFAEPTLCHRVIFYLVNISFILASLSSIYICDGCVFFPFAKRGFWHQTKDIFGWTMAFEGFGFWNGFLAIPNENKSIVFKNTVIWGQPSPKFRKIKLFENSCVCIKQSMAWWCDKL